MKNHNTDKPSSLGQAYRSVGPYLTLGIQLIVTILLCIFAGHWADGKFDTSPLLTLIGGLLGIAAGFYHFFRAILKMDRKSEEDA
ncbi:MAG: AtpZ/AtpI family protein [Candidatus Latescibacteria bacterium]|nr:AtpZ/AtpI family protein [Candidatus Latescibacterota bacterium]